MENNNNKKIHGLRMAVFFFFTKFVVKKKKRRSLRIVTTRTGTKIITSVTLLPVYPDALRYTVHLTKALLTHLNTL